MTIKNLTPHFVLIIKDGVPTIIEPEPIPARCTSTTVLKDCVEVNGTLVASTSTSFGEVEGLPTEQDGIGYIVSRVVAEASPLRHDLFITNAALRDASGKIIVCTSLSQLR